MRCGDGARTARTKGRLNKNFPSRITMVDGRGNEAIENGGWVK